MIICECQLNIHYALQHIEKQCMYRAVVRVWISTPADTLGTEVLPV